MQFGRVQGWRRSTAMLGMVCLTVALAGCPTPAPPDSPPDTPPPPTTVSVTVQGQGTVDQQVDGTTATLTANPEPGWNFDRWSGQIQSTDNPLTVTVSEVTSIEAIFVELEPPPGQPTPPVIADGDGDGVPDANDDCPDTASGASVDSRGCAANQPDADQDGVTDDLDRCPRTPAGTAVDATGCPDATLDSDGDGVNDDVDACSGTVPGATVDDTGCAASQRDTDGDKVADNLDECPDTPPNTAVDPRNGCATAPPGGGGGGGGGAASCGNRVIDAGEQCDPPDGTSCDDQCQSITRTDDPICGNGTTETGETCDDGNTVDGDGCSSTCQTEAAGNGPANDSCANPMAVTDGQTAISSIDATNDAPDSGGLCPEFGFTADVWYCYTATCTGFVTVDLCSVDFDSTLAIYAGCECPTTSTLACNDDGCEFGIGSRASVPTQTGDTFIIRVGGFVNAAGEGNMTITCGDQPDMGNIVCGAGAGDCASGNGSPGCDDAECCRSMCNFDSFCCETEWDDLCATDAAQLCSGSFDVCRTSTEDCQAAHNTPGCGDNTCCTDICTLDPFCCLREWDEFCASDAQSCTPR